jgi:hypothetical protein
MEQRMPDLCLTGTQQPFQIPGMAGAEAFEAALETYVDSISVMAIAEEMSLAGLARRKVNESIAKRVADRKGLCHCYCDLDRDERQHHGIPSREEIELRFQRQPRQEIDRQLRLLLEDPRERHWLMRLEEFGRWPVLFICGEEHVCWFAAKVRDSGRSVEILTATWKP